MTLVGVLALAAFLRLFMLNYGEYQWDDDGIWSLAVNALHTHTLPAKGINSTIGTGNGPFQVYLMMPFAAVAHEPLAGMVGVALLNVAAVYFTYRLVREFFGQRAALIAAVLFALNSWSVLYARHISVQGLLIPFQVLFFWSSARWLARGRAADLILAFLWVAIATQTYIDGLLHLGSLAIVLALGWRHLRPLPLIAGGVVWAALSARYLIQVVLGEWQFIQPSLSGPTIVDATSVWLGLVQALHTGYEMLAPQTQPLLAPAARVETALLTLEAVLYVAGVVYGITLLVHVIRRGKPADARVVALLLAWLLFPIAAYIRHQDILSWRHLALTLPLPAIFTGLLLDRVWSRGGGVLLAALGANSLGVAGVFFATIPTCVSNNVYALPYQQTFDLARSIEGVARANRAGRVYVYGQPSLGPVLGSILSRDGVDAVWFDTSAGSSLTIPQAGSPPAVYVTLDDSTGASQALQAKLSGQQQLLQPVPCEGMTVRAYATNVDAARAALEPLLPGSLQAGTGSGLEIKRVNASQRLEPGATLDVATELGWPGGQLPANATLFAHLLDASGNSVASSDRALGKPEAWAGGGDTIEWQRLALQQNLAPGRYFLELGLYGEHDQRMPLLDSSGGNIGTSARWGPLIVPPREPAPPDLMPANELFGGQIRLTGYRATKDGLDLEWQAVSQPAADYTVFVHVLDASGKLVAQADSQPRAGDFPTSAWRTGDLVFDHHPLSLAAGAYTVEAGLYELATSQRLAGAPLEVKLALS